MPSMVQPSCLRDAMRGQINFEADTFFVMLLGSDYEPNNEHERRSDLDQFEVRGQGYRIGGMKASVALNVSNEGLSGFSIDISLGGGRWLDASISARYAAYYQWNGGDSEGDVLVAVIDFGRDIVSTSGPWTLSESTLKIYALG